jgi:ATP-dependent Lon protease
LQRLSWTSSRRRGGRSWSLEKIKSRIVEYLAVRKLALEGKAPILCFAGPSGVGKTSLGQSIARAIARPFVRVSLGGVHDEAEIRASTNVYRSAPGQDRSSDQESGAHNCVMMLDEMDKLARGIQGDPSAAMLEVLDPEQNASFRDNYLPFRSTYRASSSLRRPTSSIRHPAQTDDFERQGRRAFR